MITCFYSFSGCTYLRGTSAVGGGGLPSVLAETRWLETAFSRLKHSCGVEKSCVRCTSSVYIDIDIGCEFIVINIQLTFH